MSSKPRPAAVYEPSKEIYEDQAAIDAARTRIAARDRLCRAVRVLGGALESGDEIAIVAAQKAFDAIARHAYGRPVDHQGSPAAVRLLEHQIYDAIDRAERLIPCWAAVMPDGAVYIDHMRGMAYDNFPSRGAVERFLDAMKGTLDVELKPALLPDRWLSA